MYERSEDLVYAVLNRCDNICAKKRFVLNNNTINVRADDQNIFTILNYLFSVKSPVQEARE